MNEAQQHFAEKAKTLRARGYNSSAELVEKWAADPDLANDMRPVMNEVGRAAKNIREREFPKKKD